MFTLVQQQHLAAPFAVNCPCKQAPCVPSCASLHKCMRGTSEMAPITSSPQTPRVQRKIRQRDRMSFITDVALLGARFAVALAAVVVGAAGQPKQHVWQPLDLNVPSWVQHASAATSGGGQAFRSIGSTHVWACAPDPAVTRKLPSSRIPRRIIQTWKTVHLDGDMKIWSDKIQVGT